MSFIHHNTKWLKRYRYPEKFLKKKDMKCIYCKFQYKNENVIIVINNKKEDGLYQNDGYK